MPAISPELHEEMAAQLEKLLDDQDDVREKRVRISKALGGELKIIAGAITRTRRVLKGLESPQQEIPGTEVGERRRDPAVLEILQAATRVSLERMKEASDRFEAAQEKRKAKERAELEKKADGILANAGAGRLNDPKLKGPASRRLGRRRG